MNGNITRQNQKSSKFMERVPIKITGTDINWNKLELISFNVRFLKEEEPISINQTQTNVNKCKSPSHIVAHRKSPLNIVNPRKSSYTPVNHHKSPYIPVNSRPGNVGVLTGRPPGNFPSNAQDQDVVNTVGPVPMTFGREPNTFPYSAVHVLNTNHNHSTFEGVSIPEIYASAGCHIESYMTQIPSFTGSTLSELPVSESYMTQTTHFSGSNLDLISERGVSIQNTYSKLTKFTLA